MFSGETDLAKLREQLAPTVHPATFVYCCFADRRLPEALNPVCTIEESEGLTAIVEKSSADRLGLAFEFECVMFTLAVHSSLEAVGLLALVSEAMARQGVPCNVVSGYHHDHLFVPKEMESLAMLALAGLRRR